MKKLFGKIGIIGKTLAGNSIAATTKFNAQKSLSLKPKFIIEDGNLVLSKVRFHRDMVKVPKNVTGGGSFTYDLSDMSFTFWGASADFGAASLDSIRETVLQGRVYSNNSCRRSIAHRHDFYFGGYFEHNKDKTLIQKR